MSLRGFSTWALSLALLVPTMGCTQLMKSGTGLVPTGPFGSQAPPPGRMAAKPLAQHRRPTSMTSTYEVAPTRWMAGGMGQPHSVAQGLFKGPSQTVACQEVALGLTQVLSVPGTSPATRLFDLGPFEFGLIANGVRLHDVFTIDPEVLADRAFRSGAFLASRGAQCSHSFFLYVSLRRNRSEPVLLLR